MKQSKTLVAADAMVSLDGTLRGPVQQTTLDMNMALRSLEKFLEFEIESVICYHGGLCNVSVKEQLENLIGIYLNPVIIGVVMSTLTLFIGSKFGVITDAERAFQEKILQRPITPDKAEEMAVTRSFPCMV